MSVNKKTTKQRKHTIATPTPVVVEPVAVAEAANRCILRGMLIVLGVVFCLGIGVGTWSLIHKTPEEDMSAAVARMPKATIPLLHPEWRDFLMMTDIVRRVKFRDPQYRAYLAGRWMKSPNPSNQFIANEYPRWFTEDLPPRILNVPGIVNFRDMGGWKTADGSKRIKQGMIYRSGELNGKSYYGTVGPNFVTMHNQDIMIRDLGIKTDIDLRWDTETKGMTGSPLGPAVAWQHYPWSLYQWIGGAVEMQMFYCIFTDLRNPEKLPALVHCVYGKDRTGTLCFLLEGILGVSDDDKLKDWEASAFYYTDGNFVHVKGIDGLIEFLSRTYQRPTLNENCIAYAKACGITDADIQLFRNLMLEDVR